MSEVLKVFIFFAQRLIWFGLIPYRKQIEDTHSLSFVCNGSGRSPESIFTDQSYSNFFSGAVFFFLRIDDVEAFFLLRWSPSFDDEG